MIRPHSGPQRRGHVQQAFGDQFDLFIKIFLEELPGIGEQMGNAKSETELSRLLQQHFRRRFGVDISSTHRETFIWSTRNLWRELENQRRGKQRPRRRGFRAQVKRIRKRVGL